ncbi:MAG: SLBB domain-containing protein [Chthonomonadales bacterium]|nr:SLBB domain-containing protein [Chthonomonadales bacterium]
MPAQPAEALKLFGYSYFEPAREIIDARRAALKRQASTLEAAEMAAEAQAAQPGANTAAGGQPGVVVSVGGGAGAAPGPQPVRPPGDAFRGPIDPISQLYRNVYASVPADYQLAPGDVVTLRLSSPTLEMREQDLTVDAMGALSIPEVGRVVVRGQTLAQAENGLRARLRRFYMNAEVGLALKELRTMSVTLGGEAYMPGSYSLPAVATLYNFLYSTGGPNESGSLRGIELRRGGRVVASIDFYHFLLSGARTQDHRLEPGDVVYIPPRKARVAVRGEVRRPAVYELIDGEGLAQAIEFAGGATPSGVRQRVQILTVQPGNKRVLKDVDMTELRADQPVPVYDGDTVDVFSVRVTVANKVTIEGAVDQPGEYALSDGMTVADLVERARGMLSEAYPVRADLYRYNPDTTLELIPVNLERALAREPGANVALVRWDRLKVYTRAEVAWIGRRDVTASGAVQRPGTYTRSDHMRVKDLLLQAGGTLPEAYVERAVILRQNPDGTYRYLYANLAKALQDDPENNLPLQDHDKLAVYRVDEARFTPEHTVKILGEVVAPGPYPRGENMKLSDALKLAGGLTPGASDRIVVAHGYQEVGQPAIQATYSMASGAPSPDPVLADGDVITIQGKGDYEQTPRIVVVSGAVNRPGPVVLRDRKVRLSEVIQEAGGLTPTAYPEGVEFVRSSTKMIAGEQTEIVGVISRLNDLLNRNQYQRELARSDIDRIKAISSAGKGASSFYIPGIGLTGDSGGSGAGSAPEKLLISRDLVSPPRVLDEQDLTPRGNVAVNLRTALRKPGSPDDILMLDGDRVSVPETPTTVQVIGAVVHARGVLYQERASVDDYVREAGGLAPDAAKDRIMVVRLGGGLMPARRLKDIRPGDVILVPTKVLAERLATGGNDIDNFFRSLTTSALLFVAVKKILGL